MHRTERCGSTGDEQKSRGVAIQTVYQLEKPVLRPHGAQGLDHPELQAAATVNSEAGGLVDNQQVRVFVDDGVLEAPLPVRRRNGRRPRGLHEGRKTNDVTLAQPSLGSGPAFIHADLALSNRLVETGFRYAGTLAEQVIVETLTIAAVLDNQLTRSGTASWTLVLILCLFHRPPRHAFFIYRFLSNC
jgi:hypothetical protein